MLVHPYVRGPSGFQSEPISGQNIVGVAQKHIGIVDPGALGREHPIRVKPDHPHHQQRNDERGRPPHRRPTGIRSEVGTASASRDESICFKRTCYTTRAPRGWSRWSGRLQRERIKYSFRRSVRRFSLSPSVAVAIPCYNEATTIAKIVRDFRRVLPQGEICVFDNASTDETAERAREAGARVVAEPRRGKGFVVQRVFEIVDADICVLVDGDDTYLAEDLDTLLAPILAGEADMVVGNRLANASAEALTGFRRFGNRFFIGLVNLLTRTTLHDVLCGYRAMNRRFRKAVQLQSSGFEIETELTLRAVREGMAIREVPIGYRARPTGSYSKLSPVKDGLRILWVITAQLIGLQ